MIKATIKDKSTVVDILSQSFQDNKSVNYIVRQDCNHFLRLNKLMEFCFLTCLDFGKVFLSENRQTCALVFFPDRKRISLTSIGRELKLALAVIGPTAIFKVLKRESLIKKRYPSDGKIYYVWFVGCVPESQGRGYGTQMMDFLTSDACRMKRSIFLETSSCRNINWYAKLGFHVYDHLNLGYTLYFLKN